LLWIVMCVDDERKRKFDMWISFSSIFFPRKKISFVIRRF